VGSAGDNVPRPLTAKLAMQMIIRAKPITNAIVPAYSCQLKGSVNPFLIFELIIQ